jgi:hypothetical protein
MTQKIKTELITKSTAALDEEVKKDLEVDDPTQEKAKAILENNEITTGNDSRTSS